MKFSVRQSLKWIYEAIRSAALYTVIAAFFLLFLISREGWVGTPGLSIGNMLSIFTASLLVSFAFLLFRIPRMPRFIAYVLHYATLLIGTIVIFIFNENLTLDRGSAGIFSYAILFTIAYVLLAVAAFFLRRLIRTVLKDETAVPQSEATEGGKEKNEFQSIL